MLEASEKLQKNLFYEYYTIPCRKLNVLFGKFSTMPLACLPESIVKTMIYFSHRFRPQSNKFING